MKLVPIKDENAACQARTKNPFSFFLFIYWNPLFLKQKIPAMLRTLTILLLSAVCASTVWSQGAKPPTTGVGIIYNRETAFNLKMTTNRGYAPGLEFGRLRTYYKTTFKHISLGEIKHPKERRQSADPSVSRSFRPYVYGKQNNFFVLRTGWGVKRYYSEKAKQKGVALGMSWALGPSLGMLKPYYLALARTGDQPGQSRITNEKYTASNETVFLDNTRILGAAPFSKGLGDLSLLPGANASIAFHMDWGAFDEVVKALEIGFMLDVFPKKVPILIGDQNNDRTFFNFFVNLQLGKRR